MKYSNKTVTIYNVIVYSRYRENAQSSIVKKLHDWRPPAVSLVHWDGKLMSTLDGAGTGERVPVLLSGVGGSKLLGVPALPSDTPMGLATAEVTCEALQRWNASQTVAGMVFDTTSANTGMMCLRLSHKI